MTDSRSIIAALKAQGCDTAGALDRMMGDEAFYVECLTMFAADEHFDNLERALAASDADAAFRSAHALKGVAGNLGLAGLYRALCALVEPLRQKRLEGTDALLLAVEREHKAFVASVTAAETASV